MKNILTLVLLSMWMAIPVQARTFAEVVNYQWTASAQGIDGYGQPLLVHHYAIFERKNGVDTFLQNTPDAIPRTTVVRPYNRTFRLVVQAVDKDGYVSLKSSVSADQTKIFPNFDYNFDGIINTIDLGVFKKQSASIVVQQLSMFKEVYFKRVIGISNKEYVP